MDSMFNTPQEVVQANMNGAVKKAVSYTHLTLPTNSLV